MMGVLYFLPAQSEDYSRMYAPQQVYDAVVQDVIFWEDRLNNDFNVASASRYASSLMGLFAHDSNLDHLIEAEEVLDRLIMEVDLESSTAYRLRAQIKMKSHRFCEALDDLLVSEELGDDLKLTEALLFDVYHELGEDALAFHYLERIQGGKKFDYLARLARWEDSRGHLAKAIEALESSEELISKNDWAKRSWLYSNLADFYGHDGRIEKSREFFVKALELNPVDWYSVKGLAWISYSYDRDTDQALRYLDKLDAFKEIPAVAKLRYDIYQYLEDYKAADKIQQSFIGAMTSDVHLTAYASYIYAFDMERMDVDLLRQAVDKEIEQRPVAESYAHKAMLLNRLGQKTEALALIESHILGHTYEPKPLSQALFVMDKNHGDYDDLAGELAEAVYELGPNFEKKLAQGNYFQD